MPNTIEIDKTDLLAVDRMMVTISEGKRVVIVKATNEVLKGVRTQAASLIFAKVNLKSGEIKKYFSLNTMQKSDLSADISCVGKPVPLIKYGATQINKGISVKILRKGKKSPVKHAFIAKVKSRKPDDLHTGAFWREKNIRGKHFKLGKRIRIPSPGKIPALEKFQLPIRQLYGPAVSDIFDDKDIMDATLSNADVRMEDRLKYHTGQLLIKARA